MRRMLAALPGPPLVKGLVVVLVVVVALVGILFLYDWIGTTFLDTGGTLG